MSKNLLSNAFLGLGVLILVAFGLAELIGVQADPLLPAFSAFLIGCTAVLDRVSVRGFK